MDTAKTVRLIIVPTIIAFSLLQQGGFALQSGFVFI
jgi:hypothetical protein